MSFVGKYLWLSIAISLVPLNLIFFHIIAIYPCDWPCPNCGGDSWLKVMILTDPHLLGSRKGHPVDRFAREWEMSLSFRIAKYFRSPELIIFLGDLLDEGLTATPDEFNRYVERFKTIFPIDENTSSIYIIGNHDIGFHDRVVYLPHLRHRWEKAFNSSLVDVITVKDITFVTVNSMALEGDGCTLCREAEDQLRKAVKKLKQSRLPGRPILLQHFPLFRVNDEICKEIDSQQGESRKHKFTPGLESLSPEASEMLLQRFKPRLIFNGHIHAGCVVNHTDYDAQEWTVASFNWRNRRDPNFLLLQISEDDYVLRKCFLPDEIKVALSLILHIIVTYTINRFLQRVEINTKETKKQTNFKKKKS